MHQPPSTVSSVNQLLRSDLKQLHDMMAEYIKLEEKLKLSMPHHEQQIMQVAYCMLKELIDNKTRDVRRRMREMKRYQ